MILKVSSLDPDTDNIIKFLDNEGVEYVQESHTGVFTTLQSGDMSLFGLRNIVNGLKFLDDEVVNREPDTIKELYEHHLTLAKITLLKHLSQLHSKDLFKGTTLDLALERARIIIPSEEFIRYEAYKEEISGFKRKSKFFKFEI